MTGHFYPVLIGGVMNYEYDPWKFEKLAKSNLGKQLWEFLNEHDNIIRMETATELKKPAVKALTIHLLSRFDEQVREMRVKQMIGHMVKQIMEIKGFEVDQRDVLVNDGLFHKASRYRRIQNQRSDLMKKIGFATNNKFTKQFIKDWCLKHYKPFIEIQSLGNIDFNEFRYLIIDPLRTSKTEWKKFILLYKRQKYTVPLLIVYEDLDRYIDFDAEVPLNAEVTWCNEQNDGGEIIEERLSVLWNI